MQHDRSKSAVRRVGRYALFDEIASGGMATVHLGRLLGSAGFARTVAIKRLHPTFAKEPDFVSMFTDEARLAARIRHPNVAATLDVVSEDDELFLVMEYIHGESLARLLRTLGPTGQSVPVPIAIAIMAGALHGLHAAHEATTERGDPLGVVHRDVSPQNVMVGIDGVARVLDFGVAKAVGRLQTTRDGELKGKTAYMAPEQVRGRPVDRRVDVYAASVVLWELLTSLRLFVADSAAEVIGQVLEARVEPPSHYQSAVPPEIDSIVLRGLSRDPARRFATALDMALALERTILLPTSRDVGTWVARAAGDLLESRASRVRAVEGLNVDVSGVIALPESEPGVATGDDTTREGASQISNVSMATPVALRAPKSRPRSRWLLALALVGGVSGGFVLSRARVQSPAIEAPLRSAAPTEPAASALAPGSAAVSSSEAPVAIATVSPSASSVLAEAPSGATSAPKPAKAAPRRVTVPAPRPAPAARPRNCDPPYSVDAEGIHIPKPECG